MRKSPEQEELAISENAPRCADCGAYANATVQVGQHGRRLVCDRCIGVNVLKPDAWELHLRMLDFANVMLWRIARPRAPGDTL